MEVLRTTNLSKSYGKIKALDNLNLNINSGEVYGLLGPNGSGKTTTLGIIMGILAQESGDYEWFEGQYGINPRKKIGAILETPNFYPYLDAYENLEIVRRIKKVDHQDFDDLLTTVNLLSRGKSKFRTYSLGMKQRLAIAATLIGQPEVLIFDEPTNGLDPEGIAEVRVILKRIADSGKTVIMASHILDEVEKICSHVVILRTGKLLASGPVGAILSDDNTIEIGAENMQVLRNFLEAHPATKDIKDKGSYFECQIDASVKPAEITEKAYNQGLQITHLVVRKRRLEEEFLEITKNENA